MAFPQLSHETLRYGTHSLQTISVASGPNNSPNGLWMVYVHPFTFLSLNSLFSPSHRACQDLPVIDLSMEVSGTIRCKPLPPSSPLSHPSYTPRPSTRPPPTRPSKSPLSPPSATDSAHILTTHRTRAPRIHANCAMQSTRSIAAMCGRP